MDLQPYVEGPAGDAIADYHDGTVFTRDFYQSGRVAAMVGASVREYLEANVILSRTGFDALETHVLGPDQPGKYWHEVMTTSGDIGWNPRGAAYRFIEYFDEQQNAANWIACGRPRKNAHGEWGAGGLPMDYIQWSWESVKTRGDSPLRPHGPGRRR